MSSPAMGNWYDKFGFGYPDVAVQATLQILDKSLQRVQVVCKGLLTSRCCRIGCIGFSTNELFLYGNVARLFQRPQVRSEVAIG